MFINKYKTFIPIFIANLILIYFVETKIFILIILYEALLLICLIFYFNKKQNPAKEDEVNDEANDDIILKIYNGFIDKLDDTIFITDKDFNIISQNIVSKKNYNNLLTNNISSTIRDFDFNFNLDKFKNNNEYNKFLWSRNLPTKQYFNTAILSLSKYFVIIITDITNQKLIEEKQSTYLDDLTHEIKTPLSTIVGYLETIDLENFSIEENKNFLNIINSKTFEIKSLIDKILKLSEINFTNNEKIKINIESSLNTTIDNYKNLFKKAGINFQIDIGAAKDKIILFSSGEFDFVINNLLSNALKYTPSGNKVLLTAKTKPSKKLSISVEDEGIGIPQKDIEKLTERFFRVDHSRNNLSGGHGLGLTIVNYILAKNEYFLEISSKLGEGSIFKFDLDLS